MSKWVVLQIVVLFSVAPIYQAFFKICNMEFVRDCVWGEGCFKRGSLRCCKKKMSKKDLVLQYPSHPLPPQPGRPRGGGELAGNELSVLSYTALQHCLAPLVEMNCQFCHIGSFGPLRPNTGWMTCADLGLGYQYLPYLCHLTTHQFYEDTTEWQIYCILPISTNTKCPTKATNTVLVISIRQVKSLFPLRSF